MSVGIKKRGGAELGKREQRKAKRDKEKGIRKREKSDKEKAIREERLAKRD